MQLGLGLCEHNVLRGWARTSVRRSRERSKAVLRRSMLSLGSLGEGGRRSAPSQPRDVAPPLPQRLYGLLRGSGVLHMGGLVP